MLCLQWMCVSSVHTLAPLHMFVSLIDVRCNIGIKKLIGIADYANQATDKSAVVDVFTKLLEEAHTHQ